MKRSTLAFALAGLASFAHAEMPAPAHVADSAKSKVLVG
jgi:hypothetical protein